MQAKITKRLVDEIAPSTKPQFVFDTDIAGFVLKITPVGRKVYQLRYRMGGRRTPLKTFTIGKHGLRTPDQARREAQALLGDVRRGIDPAAEKTERKAADRGARTVEELSIEFLNIYGHAKLKPRTLEEYTRAFQRHINRRLGHLKVRDVSYGDVERLHLAMRATPPTANRTVAVLSKFFSWAIRAGYRPDRQNPCSGIEKYKEKPRTRWLSQAEITAVGAAIRDCEADGRLSIWQAAFFRLLLLTGMRKNELKTLPWRCVDFERSMIVLEDSKTGPREVPMSGPAAQLLANIPRLDDNQFVFPGNRPGQPMINMAKPWKRMLLEAGIEHARIHDLRHTVGETGVALGNSLYLIGAVLGHKHSQTTERYAHRAEDPVRAVTELIAERIDRALAGKTDNPP